MALSKAERKELERLSAKEKEPEAGPISRAVSVVVNLSNKAEVEMAKKMGFLPGDEPEDDGDNDDEDDEADDVPNRRGFFDK